MKKTFTLTHPKIKYPRMIEAVKNEIRKYIKRNRKKALPEEADYWDFKCKYGDTEEKAEAVHLSEIDKHINEAEKKELKSFYIEVTPVAGIRQNKN